MTDDQRNQLDQDMIEFDFESQGSVPDDAANWRASGGPATPSWLDDETTQPSPAVEASWLNDPAPREAQKFRLGEKPAYKRESKSNSDLPQVVSRARQSFDTYVDYVKDTVQTHGADALQQADVFFMPAEQAANLIFDLTPRTDQQTVVEVARGGKGLLYNLDVVNAREWINNKASDPDKGISTRNTLRTMIKPMSRDLNRSGYDLGNKDNLYQGLRDKYKFDTAAADMFLVLNDAMESKRASV